MKTEIIVMRLEQLYSCKPVLCPPKQKPHYFEMSAFSISAGSFYKQLGNTAADWDYCLCCLCLSTSQVYRLL